jgi:phosphate acetyltransferase
MAFLDMIKKRACEKCPTIAFGDADAENIILAAKKAMELGMIKPVLVGHKKVMEGYNIDLSGMRIIDIDEQADKVKEYANTYEVNGGDLPAEAVEPIIADPVGFACMMVATGEADGILGGFLYPTAEVINAATLFFGLAEGILTPSSFIIVDSPHLKCGEDGLMAFADCTFVPQPDSEALASIAINTATAAKEMLQWEPRVALLSFSTKGSANHKDVKKVQKAVEILHEKCPDMLVDGELQLDAAIVPQVALKKIKGDNPLKGNANILIFPDLDAGNLCSKMAQLYGECNIYGALICGFAKPIAEVSRSFGVDDLVGAIGMLASRI